jgi:hypothetical protein
MLHKLAEWNPHSVLLYRWNYAFDEIEILYTAKIEEFVERRSMDYEFLVNLAKAALGGDSKKEGEYGMDDGEGFEERTEEQDAELRAALGDDYYALFGDT